MKTAFLLYGPAADVAHWLNGDDGADADLADLRAALGNAMARIDTLERALAQTRGLLADVERERGGAA